jgi:ribosomal-protein-alanine N-acetyltransferase
MVPVSLDGGQFFRTERLAFRPFSPQDIDDLAAMVADPEVVRFVGDGQPLSREQAAEWISKSRANVARFGYGTGAVVELATGEMVGWAGIARPEGEPEEIVYGFASQHWGKGYGPEVVAGLVEYAFGTLGLPELRATVYPANARSARILERQGFLRRARSDEEDADSHLYVRVNALAN